MATSEIIAAALARVKNVTDAKGAQIINTSEISRTDREILSSTGWLQEIIRSWYMLVRPDVATGDSAAWYANFWDFIRIYLKHRFDDECFIVGWGIPLDSSSSKE